MKEFNRATSSVYHNLCSNLAKGCLHRSMCSSSKLVNVSKNVATKSDHIRQRFGYVAC